MGKKRVHEIQRELKERGIEIESKDLVTELQSFDLEVKSHSSSLDEDQANMAIDKIVQKRRPKPAAAPVAAAGFVVRKRRPDAAPPAAPPAEEVPLMPPPEPRRMEPVAAAPVAPPAAPPSHSPSPPVEATPAVVSRAEVVASAAPVTPPAPSAPPPSVVEPRPEPVREAPAAAPVSVSAPVPPASVAPVSATPAAPTPPTPSAPVTGEAPSAPAPMPGASPPTIPLAASGGPSAAPRPVAGTPGAPVGPRPAVVSRPGSRPSGFKPAEVIPGRIAPGFKPPVRPPPRPAGSAPGRGPGGARPTANQAVVVTRPAFPARRVTPPTGAHTRYPAAPGPRALGTTPASANFFPPPSDRPDREAEKKRGGGRADLVKTPSKQELVDLARGRVGLPMRVGKKKRAVKKGAKTQITQMAEEKKVLKLDESMTVSELSQTMSVKAGELLRKLIASKGMGITINSSIDADTIEIIAADYGWRVERHGFEIEDYISEEVSNPEALEARPPVVTIMGHVDHGKTSLLDAIRAANVAAGEAGGITQHIGAYAVQTEKGQWVTFLDTPGHEAFTAMRARGAQITDLVVIVVAADDGVMPQTREAINHAKAAEVPILVAINKIDKPGANPQQVKNQLMEFGLVDEALGGDTIMVPVSAKTKTGIPELLEMILLQAEVLELKADPSRPPKGSVVEAKLEKGRGPTATVIVQEGTLRVGDALVTGVQHGRIRAMLNDRGERVDEVKPGFPVEILGLSGVPTAGDDFYGVEDEASAKEVAEHRLQKEREKDQAKTAKVRLEDLFARVQAGEAKELKLIVKADVQGSVEAVTEALRKLSTPKVQVKIIDSGVGAIRESDVMLASASDGMVVGFNVRPEPKTSDVATQQGVDIRLYSIIYEAVDEVRRAMEGLLEPTRREKVLGRAEVRSIFSSPKVGNIAGCAVVDGKIARSAQVRLLRDSRVICTGKLGSLRRFKDDVREVLSGFECGLSIEGYNDVKQGDVIEAFEIEEIRATL